MEATAGIEVTRMEVATKGAAATAKATNGGGGVVRSGWVALRVLGRRYHGVFVAVFRRLGARLVVCEGVMAKGAQRWWKLG